MSISDKERSELQDSVLQEHGFLRGTTSLKILKFLFGKAGQKASAGEIALAVFGSDKPEALQKLRSCMIRLRERLNDYFAFTSEGQQFCFRLRIVLSGQDYLVDFVLNPLRPDCQSPKVFLCHSSNDKAAVRELHSQLKARNFAPWLDEVDLVPGKNWDAEIKNAVRLSDIVLVCLSKSSINKEGYVQKEIKLALDSADEKPEDLIYIIPARLEECPLPRRLAQWHCVDLFRPTGFEKLCLAIRSKQQ